MLGWLLMAWITAGLAAGPEDSLQRHTLVVDGRERVCLVYVPESIRDAAEDAGEDPEPVPLVFMLHGGGGGPDRVATGRTTEGRWQELAERDGFIVAFPAGVEKRWNDCRAASPAKVNHIDDAAFFEALLGELTAELPIDTDRIYATGHSNGGIMAFSLAMRLPERFAAVASCTGAMPARNACGGPREPVPILYMAGTEDPLVPFEGGPVAPTRRRPEGQGAVLSAAETVRVWREANGATGEAERREVADSAPDDGSHVVVTRWPAPETGAEVVYYEIVGGGHAWPSPTQHRRFMRRIVGKKNQDINGADEIWAFFQRHSLDERSAESP